MIGTANRHFVREVAHHRSAPTCRTAGTIVIEFWFQSAKLEVWHLKHSGVYGSVRYAQDPFPSFLASFLAKESPKRGNPLLTSNIQAQQLNLIQKAMLRIRRCAKTFGTFNFNCLHQAPLPFFLCFGSRYAKHTAVELKAVACQKAARKSVAAFEFSLSNVIETVLASLQECNRM
eukprot:s4660_g5.t1